MVVGIDRCIPHIVLNVVSVERANSYFTKFADDFLETLTRIL